MSQKSVTKFENLSNEILFDTFEYIYGDQLFRAFNGLNYRINSILKDYRLLSNLVFPRIEDIQSVIDPNQIRNVYVKRGTSTVGLLSTTSFVDRCSPMPHACRLSISQIYVPDLVVGLRHITHKMPYLIHVAISTDQYSPPFSNNIVYIIEGLLGLCRIRTLSLELNHDRYGASYGIVDRLLSQEKRSTSLEYLSIINCKFSLVWVIDLIKQLPSLNSLQMTIQNNNQRPDFSVFQQLTKATLNLVGFTDGNLQNFFSSMIRLRSLRLENEKFILMARLHVPNSARISRLPDAYFYPSY